MEEEVCDNELRLLEVMADVSRSLKNLNRVLTKLNKQTVDLSNDIAITERQMNALYVPFRAVLYEMRANESQGNGATNIEMDPISNENRQITNL